MPAETETKPLAEILDRLLAGECGDAFGFVSEAEPYVGRSGAAGWHRIQRMLAAGKRRQALLASHLEDLGATPRPACSSAANQYLAFLSMEFVLPKLIEAKQRSIRSYEQAIAEAGDSNAAVADLLATNLEEHRQELQVLRSLMTPAASPKKA